MPGTLSLHGHPSCPALSLCTVIRHVRHSLSAQSFFMPGTLCTGIHHASYTYHSPSSPPAFHLSLGTTSLILLFCTGSTSGAWGICTHSCATQDANILSISIKICELYTVAILRWFYGVALTWTSTVSLWQTKGLDDQKEKGRILKQKIAIPTSYRHLHNVFILHVKISDWDQNSSINAH